MTFPTIQRYNPAAGPMIVGVDTQSRGCVSLDGSKLFTMREGNTSDSAGLRVYDVATSAVLSEVAVATIYGADNTVDYPYVVTPDGNNYIRAKSWPNGSAETSVISSSLGLVSAWNSTNAGGAFPSLPNAPGVPQTFGSTSIGGFPYVGAAVSATIGKTVNIFQAGAATQFAGFSFDVDEAQAFTTGTPAGTGIIYVLGYGPNAPSAAPIGVYGVNVNNGAENYNNANWPALPNSFISRTKLGTFLPSNIAGDWSTVVNGTQAAYDRSDGNLLIFIQTTDIGAAFKDALVKISSTDGHVIWSIMLPSGTASQERFNSMGASIVDGGLFRYVYANKLYIFNTTLGTIVSVTTLSNVFPDNSIDNAPSNSVFFTGQWFNGATPPFPVGGISGTGTRYWYRIQVGPTSTDVSLGGTYIIAEAGTLTVDASSDVTLTGVEIIAEAGDLTVEVAPPPGPSILPAYPYVQYNDDDDIQAFFGAYNEYAQAFSDWANALHLPVYTSDPISGALLDWVAEGLYGMARPFISSAAFEFIGPLDTFSGAELGFAYDYPIGDENLIAVTDDIFRRILTWHIQKSYGKLFNIRWLKRRIIQFLRGVNGVPFNVDETYEVSVTFGPGNQVNINFSTGTWSNEDGIYCAWAGFAEYAYAQQTATFTPNPNSIDGTLLKAAIQSGALELPFQFTYIVNL